MSKKKITFADLLMYKLNNPKTTVLFKVKKEKNKNEQRNTV